ncbi:hypothetical protein CPLU01_08013 [Colletotrichum plurivorum]|uniref:Uncharacterized protein n=1 Tax=Colletotrichum plurivorum TaxID=2175906 RepID=A0A8H6NDF7_9PEZI|nr:hypothetical protein CPLU01_08013 [Colletotrichum plurivorum]
MDACLRKVKTQRCTIGIEDENFCRNLGIGSDRCDADCCDTITGWGVRCPG